MNYGQASRAMEAVLDFSNGVLKDETPVLLFIDGEIYKQVVAIYPEDIDGRIVVVIEAGQ